MRVLMLGWEFPPFISGGLGTACRGLTDALRRTDTRVLFVLPRSVESVAAAGGSPAAPGFARFAPAGAGVMGGDDRVTVAAVASAITSPYHAGAAERGAATGGDDASRRGAGSSVRLMGVGAEGGYDGDLVGKIQAYADRCMYLVRREIFDVIHAHDWMTYPAAMAIAEMSGRPLVTHVHATEFDRTSDPTGGSIHGIEQAGMRAAARVLAVSRLTRDTVVQRYGVPADRVTVVHNGIDPVAAAPRGARGGAPTVLFLGRVTRQKGPLVFIRAAARVARRVPGVRFVVAGAGDQLEAAVALARELGIAGRVEFTGFLRGADVDRAYERASVYVMPSVSEPFGLTALEAAARGVPVIVSRASGVAEVLEEGSLKVEPGDVEATARMIVEVLTDRSLADSLARAGAREAAGTDWDSAARRCIRTYYEVTDGVAAAREAVAA
jgi:glycosyltransferase involved in cell wall biosynthesis